MTLRKTSETQSWDAFWAEVSPREQVEIRGVVVDVPIDMPLIVEQRVVELQDSSDPRDVAELVALLFGADCMEQWRDAGMGLREFQTVLTWGLAKAAGKDITFADAVALVEEGRGAGKAPPNRAARRAQSAATGGRSKPTTNATTGSRRRTSRT